MADVNGRLEPDYAKMEREWRDSMRRVLTEVQCSKLAWAIWNYYLDKEEPKLPKPAMLVFEAYRSQLDYSKVVEMGDFYTVLNGDIVAVGFDPETGESRSLTDGETARVEGYFTVISRPGSGAKAVDDIRHGITPGGYDISVESHDCTSGRNALAADAPAMDAPGKDDQNIG